MTIDIKIEIGHKIRQERERQKLTREDVCGTETELTVKQLMRIELGQSLPTITKLKYLSQQLGTTFQYFLGDEKLEIPQDYFDRKYHLMKSPVYGDKERIRKKKLFIDDIYRDYMNILPEEELLSLDIIERSLDLINTGKDEPIEDIFDDYLEQVKLKQVYTFNDLLLIDYFAIQCQDLFYKRDQLDDFRIKLLNQELVSDEMYNVELLVVLFAIAGVYVVHNDYKHMLSLVKKMNEILTVTMMQAYKPGVLVFEAKYYLYCENDKSKAKELYHSATVLAEQFNDIVFIENLKAEIEKDMGQG